MAKSTFQDRRTKAFRKSMIDWADPKARWEHRKKQTPRPYIKKKDRKPFDQKSYSKEYREKHLAKITAYQKEYHKANRERAREKQKDWRSRNHQKFIDNVKRYRKRHPEKAVQWNVKCKYGLSLEQLAALGMECNICRRSLKRRGDKKDWPHIDHDHLTDEVRGILCVRCNAGIGQFRDDVGLLWKAIVYLSRGKIREVS